MDERTIEEKIRDEKLMEARGKAWSYPGAKQPKGEYLGAVQCGNITNYYYKDGDRYWFESDFEREMREKERLRRRREYESGYHHNRRRPQ